MADAGHALSYYFTYNALYDARYYHSTDAEWNALLKTDLDNSRPILYAGTDSDGTGGHAWVCDGYQGAGNDYFHFNFGWSGDGNGYFYLNDITPGFGGDYSYNSEAVLNIYPSPAVTPAASFTSNKTNILVNEYIILTNTSTNNPLDYNWVVTPSTGFTYVGSTSPTAKTPYIKFTSPGDYTIALTAINAAGSNTMTRANYIHVGASGIESNTENSLSIYPNPTKGLIHISLGNMGNSNVEISVYNYIGAFVKNVKVQNIVDNNITIDLSDQSQGIYYISVKSEDQIITRKITLVN
jgi:PKD repeat protein